MNNGVVRRLVHAEGTVRVFEMDDGNIVERHGGSVSWRNNNPGNLKFEYAGSADKTVKVNRTKDKALADAQRQYEGIVDLDQWGNAIFESYEAGRVAKIHLLRRNYGDRAVEDMLRSYSRADCSGAVNHQAQADFIYNEGARQGVELRNKTIGAMTDAEITALADGIKGFEGWRIGEARVMREEHDLASQESQVIKASDNNVLKQGVCSSSVGELQAHLHNLGYTDLQGHLLTIDHNFGRNTRHAVKNFQRDHGLSADGVAGPNTWAALHDVIRTSSVASSITGTTTHIFGQSQNYPQEPLDTSPAYPSDTANQQLALLQAQVLEMQRQMEAMIRQRELGHEKERGDSFAVSSETPRHAAFDEYTPAQRISGRLGYNDSRHPQHDLYVDVKERLKADGHHLPEDRLTQVVGEMHMRGFQPNWEGYAKVHNDAVYVSDFSPWANRLRVDLKEPAPSVQETLRQVDDHQQTLTQQQASREQQTQSRGHGHPLSP